MVHIQKYHYHGYKINGTECGVVKVHVNKCPEKHVTMESHPNTLKYYSITMVQTTTAHIKPVKHVWFNIVHVEKHGFIIIFLQEITVLL